MKNDRFFRPKDILKREDIIKQKYEPILSKIKFGLQNIKTVYVNESNVSDQERLFLKIFSKFHLSEIHYGNIEWCFLRNKDNRKKCFLNLKFHIFYVSYDYIWIRFEKKFHWKYYEFQLFMEQMLNEYFGFNDFVIDNSLFINEYP